MDEVKFYKTKLYLEVSVETQFGPKDAIWMVNNLLTVPAITGVKLTKVDTDYVPLTEQDVNREAVANVPRQLR